MTMTDYRHYYVYFHRATDGDVVYVGHGKGARAWIYGSRKTCLRSPEHLEWIHIQDNLGRLPNDYVDIVERGLSKKEAAGIERDWIDKLSPMFNKSVGIWNLKIDREILEQFLQLRDEGLSYKEIGEVSGLSTMTVYRALNKQTKSVNKWEV